MHESNQIVSLFGHYFLAFDYNTLDGHLYGFETFKEGALHVDLVASIPDNSRVLFYSKYKHKLYNL